MIRTIEFYNCSSCGKLFAKLDELSTMCSHCCDESNTTNIKYFDTSFLGNTASALLSNTLPNSNKNNEQKIITKQFKVTTNNLNQVKKAHSQPKEIKKDKKIIIEKIIIEKGKLKKCYKKETLSSEKTYYQTLSGSIEVERLPLLDDIKLSRCGNDVEFSKNL